MKLFKYLAFSILGISLAGFVWLGWFLVATPSTDFDHQGPGLFGAFVMFGSQVLGVTGIVLLIIWKFLSILLNSKKSRENV